MTAEVPWGKPGNNVTIGLVGMPNVGKSSTFNLFGQLQVAAENYPFCTIDPAQCTVEVPDPRYTHLVDCWKPKSRVPAILTVTDIAGLVKGASEGQGLGNAFLTHIQAVDAIYHVTRAFADKDIEHVEGEVGPARDLEIISGELRKKDIEWVKNAHETLDRSSRNKRTKEQGQHLEYLAKALEHLESGKDMRHGEWKSVEVIYLNHLNLLTSKPVVYLVNISDKNFMKLQNKYFKEIKEWITTNSPGDPLIPFSVTFEQKLMAMETEAARKAFCAENKTTSMMPKIIKSGFKALKCINFFTTGADEVRAWTIRENTLAPKAAGTIHTDFEKTFVKAEQYHYDNFKEFGSEEACKAKGTYRQQGKNYVVVDGDILFFKCGAAKGGK